MKKIKGPALRIAIGRCTRLPPHFFGLLESKTYGVVPARSLGLKDLQVQSLRTNDLTFQRALKMGLGQFRGPSWSTGSKTAPIRSLSSRTTGLKSMDFGCGWRTSPPVTSSGFVLLEKTPSVLRFAEEPFWGTSVSVSVCPQPKDIDKVARKVEVRQGEIGKRSVIREKVF
jgi:hypothetical protein